MFDILPKIIFIIDAIVLMITNDDLCNIDFIELSSTHANYYSAFGYEGSIQNNNATWWVGNSYSLWWNTDSPWNEILTGQASAIAHFLQRNISGKSYPYIGIG